MEVTQKVMIVEDDVITAKDLKNILEKQGLVVTGTASRGEDAVHLAEETKPDLVLMDIVLHGNTEGITAAVRIYHKYNIPVIFLSADFSEHHMRRVNQLEGFYYVSKPFNDQDLYELIDDILRMHTLQAKLNDYASADESG